MSRRFLILANPIAGGGKARHLGPALRQELARRDIESEVYFTTSGGDGRRRAAATGGEDWTGVVAVGGDGTVNEVLNGLPDPELPLAVLPLGTANVLAAELRLPRKPSAVAECIAAGHELRAPIGLADERRFLLFTGVGVDGAIVERLAGVRTGTLGKHKWAGPILRTVWSWPRYRLRATFDDGSVLEDLSEVLVTRSRNYGGILRLTPGIAMEEPVLHALCFRSHRRLSWIGWGLRALTSGLRPGRHLEVRRTTEVRIEGGEPVPYQVDGDLGGRSPVRVRLSGRRSRLLVPAPLQSPR